MLIAFFFIPSSFAQKKSAAGLSPHKLRRRLQTNATNPNGPVFVLPPVDATASALQGYVLAMIDVGMDQNQIMGVLSSKGYGIDELERIFQGHDEENDILLHAFQDIAPTTIGVKNATRELVDPSSEGAGVAYAKKQGFAPGELETLLQALEDEAQSRFAHDANRDLQSDDPCERILTSNTKMGAQVSAAYEYFTSRFDSQDYGDLFDRASSVSHQKLIAQSIGRLPVSSVLSCVAKSIDSTISIGFSFDATFFFFNADFGINIIFGEDGQFAVSHTTGFGFDIGLLGVGVAVGVSVSNREIHGGFDTVGSALNNPDICFSIGYTPFLVGGAITFSMTSAAVGRDLENKAVDRISSMLEGTKKIGDGDLLHGLLGLFLPCDNVQGW